jgi:hypothetical protein
MVLISQMAPYDHYILVFDTFSTIFIFLDWCFKLYNFAFEIEAVWPLLSTSLQIVNKHGPGQHCDFYSQHKHAYDVGIKRTLIGVLSWGKAPIWSIKARPKVCKASQPSVSVRIKGLKGPDILLTKNVNKITLY